MSDFYMKFGGIGRLFGLTALEKIKSSRVLVIGIGGVGSWIAESLARTGVGHISLVDLDDLCVTNINRQSHALVSTVGKFKVDVMKERIESINPDCQVSTHQCFISPKSISAIFSESYDFIIDACDDFSNKAFLIDHCYQHKLPLIVIGGAGGKIDPQMIRVTDLSFSQNDRLLARLRKKLRQEFQFPDEKTQLGIWAVWSHERARYPTPSGCLSYRPPGMAKNMDCAEGFGSASFVTGAFAFAATSLVIRKLTEEVSIIQEDER